MAAVEMYRWNSAITAAFWEPIGHLEVALRNTLDDRLAARHRRLDRPGSWLDDPAQELSSRARLDIAGARDRVRQKGKRASDGQTISELGFGFWRFLITKKLTGLWPDIASGFPHAPDRRRETVEGPLEVACILETHASELRAAANTIGDPLSDALHSPKAGR